MKGLVQVGRLAFIVWFLHRVESSNSGSCSLSSSMIIPVTAKRNKEKEIFGGCPLPLEVYQQHGRRAVNLQTGWHRGNALLLDLALSLL